MAVIALFADLIMISKTPPKCGAYGGLIVHLIPLLVVFACTSGSLHIISHNSLLAATKFVPLSDNISYGTPLLFIIRFSAFKKLSTSKP